MNLKKIILAAVCFIGASVQAQENDSISDIGDNFDLYAVLDAFKNSENLEGFEKAINDPENKINNLDLDQDSTVDYIEVIDMTENDAHAFIMRISISETESQDVAVIELEKVDDDNKAYIQIIGDEDLYGSDYIIEPKEEETRGQMPPVIVNVWSWPCVGFVYAKNYKPWVSPWGHHRYPAYWHPRKPYHHNVYAGFHHHHRTHYNVVHIHRNGNAHKVYKNHRKSWSKIKHHPHHHDHKSTVKNQNNTQKKSTNQKKTTNQKKKTNNGGNQKNNDSGNGSGNTSNKKKTNNNRQGNRSTRKK